MGFKIFGFGVQGYGVGVTLKVPGIRVSRYMGG